MSPYRRRQAQRDEVRARQLVALNTHFADVERGISERVRYIAFGIAAVTYALFSSESGFATRLVDVSRWPLLVGVIAATLTIAADFCRQHFRYVASEQAYSHADFDWNTKSVPYRASEALRPVMLFFLAVAVVAFLVAMAAAFQRPPPNTPDDARPAALEHKIAETERALELISSRVQVLESRPQASRCQVRSERWFSNGDYETTCSER